MGSNVYQLIPGVCTNDIFLCQLNGHLMCQLWSQPPIAVDLCTNKQPSHLHSPTHRTR